MNIKKVTVGMLETDCYIVSDENGCIVIDPGDSVEEIIKEIGELRLEKIVLTHLHFDHIIAARELKIKTNAKILCHRADLEILEENLLSKNEIDEFIDENYELRIMNHEFKIIETPGHTPGSVCLYNANQKILFSGDTIFAGSIGVTHFKGGDFGKIKDSIENKLFTLPDDIHVYPGHGRDFLLGDEREEIEVFLK